MSTLQVSDFNEAHLTYQVGGNKAAVNELTNKLSSLKDDTLNPFSTVTFGSLLLAHNKCHNKSFI